VNLLAKFWTLSVSGVIIYGSVCLADHLPPELQARGKPEKRLAGIHLDGSKVSDVIKIYGKPTEVKKQSAPADLKVVDTYDYYWNKRGIKLGGGCLVAPAPA
jgi:hypothetical protein